MFCFRCQLNTFDTLTPWTFTEFQLRCSSAPCLVPQLSMVSTFRSHCLVISFVCEIFYLCVHNFIDICYLVIGFSTIDLIVLKNLLVCKLTYCVILLLYPYFHWQNSGLTFTYTRVSAISKFFRIDSIFSEIFLSVECSVFVPGMNFSNFFVFLLTICIFYFLLVPFSFVRVPFSFVLYHGM